MTKELAENAHVYSCLPLIKNYKISKDCVIPFGFRKGKTGNFNVPNSELNPFSAISSFFQPSLAMLNNSMLLYSPFQSFAGQSVR